LKERLKIPQKIIIGFQVSLNKYNYFNELNMMYEHIYVRAISWKVLNRLK